MSSKFPGKKKDKAAGDTNRGVDVDLLELENYIRDIWKFLPVPICQVSPRGVILDTDKAFEELLKYSRNEIIGTLLSTLFAREHEFEHIQETTLAEGSVKDYRLMLKSKEKDNILVNVSTLVRKDEAGQHVGYFASFIDVTERERICKALKESEAKYRNLVEQSFLGIIIAQVKPFKIFFANSAAAHTFGYTADEFTGLPPEEIQKRVHPDDIGIVFERFKALIEGKPSGKQEIRIRKKDGAERWIEIYGHRIEHEGIPMLQVVVLDITERREAEGARVESELRYKVLFEKSPLSITIVNTSGVVTDCNMRTEQMIGYHKEEIRGRRFDELLTLKPESLPAQQERYEKLAAGHDIEPYELEIIKKDGTKRIIRVTNATVTEKGQIMGFQIIAADITGQKEMENELRNGEQKYMRLSQEFKGILNAIPDNLTFQGLDMKIVWANQAAAQSINKRVDQVIGEYCFELWHGRKGPCEGCPVIRAMERKLPIKGKMPTPDGRHWEVRGFPILENGVVRGAVELARDTTERKRMEEDLQRSERMKLLAQLAMGVSHEVRNPLGAILASTEALYHDLEEHSEYSEYLSHIRIQVNRLSVLMKDLLELGRPIGESTFENESLQMLCSSGVELWKQSTAFKHHTMKFVKPDDFENIVVRADGARLQQVCLNLLENAAQNSPEGSEIMLKIFEPGGGSVRIQVIDEGSGIKTEDLNRVFEPFFSTRRQGSGLGLSIVKQIVEAHGGAVEIRNNEGEPGCTAEIRLPVVS